jgi:hypothetical protein
MRRRRRLMLVSVVLISNSYGAVAASVDAMQPTFGNTVVLVGTDKLQTLTQFTPDGRFVGRIPGLNYLYGGTWKIDSTGTLCRWYDLPVPNRPNPECNSFTMHSIRDTWTASGVTISIVQGTL